MSTIFEQILMEVNEHIKQANGKTEQEMIDHYESFGFTKEDFDETKNLCSMKSFLWLIPEVAKKQRDKAAESCCRDLAEMYWRPFVVSGFYHRRKKS